MALPRPALLLHLALHVPLACGLIAPSADAHDGKADWSKHATRGTPHPETQDPRRFLTSRQGALQLPLPEEKDAFSFVVFGDRTGGPAEGVAVLDQAVSEVNLLEPDLVMTVGDLIQGYNEEPEWLAEMREFKGIMDKLLCPWFPVVGNHDIYWRGKGPKPKGEHEANYEMHFGPLWYAFEHKNCWFIALHSDEGEPTTGLKAFNVPAAQKMSVEQFEWLASVLAKAKGADHVFLFLHHPRWLKRGYGDDWDRVHELLKSAGNVTAVFAGHIHRMRYDGKRDGIEYFTLATVGGHQDAFAAKAGFLHQYHVVVVRKDRPLAVAAFPVGAAMDPRAITGDVSKDIEALHAALVPRFGARLEFAADGALDGWTELEVANPTRSPVEATVALESDDNRWSFEPDHQHMVVPPGGATKFALRLRRAAGAFDEHLRAPIATLDVDYLADNLRVPLPTREWAVPLSAKQVAQSAPKEDRALRLDGRAQALRVDSRRLALPDGAFTLEGWIRPGDMSGRRGLFAKTEQSEYGIFVSDGAPSFTVHLGGRYAKVEGAPASLARDRWQHVAGVHDGAELRLYVDGALVGRAAAQGKRTKNDLPLILGADVNKDGQPASHYAGDIDEVRLSEGARYAGERFTPARRLESDPLARFHYRFDGALWPLVLDAGPGGLEAEAIGAPALVPAGAP
ncbi:MAG: hypothetical protein RIR65_427 [Planctomycetota bacterium]